MGDTDQTSREGIHLAGLAATQAGLIFREHATSDFGIDAHLETRSGAKPTGRLIAAQIKAGASRFMHETDTGYWHSITARHRELWINHSLPVVVVLCNLEDSICYWQLVTEESCVAAGNTWKILVSKSSTINASQLEALTDIASPIAAASDYTIRAEKDESHSGAKRISLDIIAHARSKGLNKPMLGAIVRDALRVGQESQYARDAISAHAHAGKRSDVVFGYVYLRESDRPLAAWVCRFQWVSPDLDATFRPSLLPGEVAGEGLIIDWNLDNDRAGLSDATQQSKSEYLARVDQLIAQAPAIQHMLETINQVGCLDETTAQFPTTAKMLEESWDGSRAPPPECQQLHEAILELLAVVGNAGLIWDPPQTRTLDQTLGLSRRYQTDMTRLRNKLVILREEVR